ncbi:MAG: division/cell wall cluster transcriptional repressor MraZ [Phycisphaerales bacterium]
MPFTGEYEHTIDAKQRVAIPSDIRAMLVPEEHGSGFYAVEGSNGAIWIWPEATFKQMADAMVGSLLPDEDLAEFEELYYSQASRLELDSAGRVRLTDRLLVGAGISKQVTILGVRDHLELRDPDDWSQRLAQRQANRDAIMKRAREAMRAQQQGAQTTTG